MEKYTFKSIFFSKIFAILFFSIVFLSQCYLVFLPSTIESLIEYASIFLSLAVICLYVLNFKFSKFTTCFTIFVGILMLATLVGEKSSFMNFFKIYYRIVAITYYIDWGIKNSPKNIIKSLFYTLFGLIAINFITIILYPSGMYMGNYKNNWFLGYDNTHIFWFIPALIVSYINTKINNKKVSILGIILFLMITYSVFYCFSANSVVAYTLLLLYIILKKPIDSIDFFNSKTYFILFIVLFFLIVVFRIQEIFSWLIVDILHKDLTFTNRTIIWDRIVVYIKDSLLLGYGQEGANIIAMKLGSVNFSHAHNTIFDVIYKGGLLSCIPFILMILSSINELYKNKKRKITKIIAFSIFCFFIMMLFEARQEKIGLYLLFVIAFNIKHIIDYIKNEKITEEG